MNWNWPPGPFASSMMPPEPPMPICGVSATAVMPSEWSRVSSSSATCDTDAGSESAEPSSAIVSAAWLVAPIASRKLGGTGRES